MRTVNRSRAGRLLLLPLTASLLLSGTASARLPEPNHVFYGTALRNGVALTEGAVAVRLEASPVDLASYVLGSDPKVGDRYVLRVPIDAVDPREPGMARPGDAVQFFVDGVPAGSATVGERGEVQMLDVDPAEGGLPTLSIGDISLYEGNAGTTAFNFTVTLSAAIGADVTFNWGTAVGTATSGIDYVGVPATTVGTVQAGNTTAVLTVTVNGETFQEDNETFLVNLSNVSANATIFDGQAVGTILDDDRPPAISIADVQVLEGDAGNVAAVFQLTTTRPIAQAVTVNFATANNTATTANNDYQSAVGVATFLPNTTATTVTVQVVGDNVNEEDESFFVNLSGASVNATIADSQAGGTIYDDDGFLTFIEAESLALIEALYGVSGLAVSPDGAHLYATGQFDDAISVFSRNSTNGALTFVEVLRDGDVQGAATIDGLDGAESVAVSPDGAHVYTAGFNDGAVAVFARTPATGQLTYVETHKDLSLGGTASGLLGASSIAMSADGGSLYVASFTSDAVAHFQRDTVVASPTYGALTFQTAVIDNAPGVNGLDGATSVRLSPNGDHLYVASSVEKAIAVFSRDGGTGALTWVEAKFDGQGGANGLDGVNGLALSVDGQNLYATGAAEDALAVFGRDDSTGALTFRNMLVDGVDGIDGLDGVSSVQVSFDGRYVFAGGYLDDSLDVFGRDAATGDLTLLERHRNGFSGETGLARVIELAVSADDQHIYGAGQNDDAIAVFMRDAIAPLGPSSLGSPSHTVSLFSNDPTVDIAWSGAVDNPGGSGLAGYSIVFDNLALTNPDGTIEVPQTAASAYGATSPPLPDGTSFWFHLRACDLAGNCSLTQHLGPFFIDSTAPGNPAAVLSTSHALDPVLNTDRTIDMSWSAASDNLSLVDGYSFFFDNSASGTCDPVKDVEETTLSTTSATFDDGTWYFHLCTRDNAGNWSVAAHAGPYIIEAAPPRVVAVETVADTADGLLSAGETLVTPITQIVVTFSEPVADPLGDSDPDDVTNPANFQLIRPGVDGTFQTTSCVAVGGDDVKSQPGSVVYLEASRTAIANYDSNVSLPASPYRLLVCGSTSIVDDNAGNALDGDSNGTGGDDLVLPFEVLSSDLLRNPNFDSSINLWSTLPATPGVVRFDAEDSDAWAVSGSVLMEFVAGTPVYGVSQCVPVVDTSDYVFGGLVLTVSPSAVDPETFGQVQYFGSTNCTTTVLGSEVFGGIVAGDTAGLWTELPESIHTPPAGARSAYVSFLADAGAAPSFATSFDTLYFRVEVGSLFADGFESGDSTLWSATVP
ncbi:MAG: beta-propeller fold lactonase family protein [Thermoanaerobaculia bacterium]|nr:beta-propeller fold lactonase family protein [Thermoanaerobaculia bacterium]